MPFIENLLGQTGRKDSHSTWTTFRGADQEPLYSRQLPALRAGAKTVLATAYSRAGDAAASLRLTEQAAADLDALLKNDPGNVRLLQEAAEASRMLSYRAAATSRAESVQAERTSREHYRTLTAIDPSNKSWRHQYPFVHMMECYALQAEGKSAEARAAFKTFDALLEEVVSTNEDYIKLAEIAMELARMAHSAGDDADARAHLAIAESRALANIDRLPTDSFDRVRAGTRWLGGRTYFLYTMGDWPELTRAVRELIAACDQGLARMPGDVDLLIQQADGHGLLGKALVETGDPAAAIAACRQAMSGYASTPYFGTTTLVRRDRVNEINTNLALALTQTHDPAVTKWPSEAHKRRAIVETILSYWEGAIAGNPGSPQSKHLLAMALVGAANVLEATTPEIAAYRQSLLDRATPLLADLERSQAEAATQPATP